MALVHSTYSSRVFDTDKYKLETEWNKDMAMSEFCLYREYKIFTDGFARPRKQWKLVANNSDIGWAQRTAAHYGLDFKESDVAQPQERKEVSNEQDR